ncbi:ComEA family DNA-binding protein [Flavobacterium agrisoli]|uniref:Helix-hairpin-helix domain-containing protein n=1 Tax=Flavobacterium agrisoli TaxID=2793066 RepID=A0A934PPY7_9FLAO|nr:helix-hairpin-helix domain-containing protein [Flavobacterium agrisoli]MBK0370468.1 helix-hairpin-helix domain-containing protein [Flavobacterium agrisoli]
MRKSNSNWFLKYSKKQQISLVVLVVICLMLQFVLFSVDFSTQYHITPEEQNWIGKQKELEAIKAKSKLNEFRIYTFNPNYLSDYKGYKLGMSTAEIDRLLAFRKQNKYVNSAAEFQKVTQISDSLLKIIAPYFKFPSWVKNKPVAFVSNSVRTKSTMSKIKTDINLATAADLERIYGIGEKLAQRILSYKAKVGGFVSMKQLDEIWGLSPEVLSELDQNFKIIQMPVIKKVNINNASLKELSQFPYFNYASAKQILIYRSMNGDFHSIEDLIKIKDFPVEKANIIALYLDF